MNSLSKYLQHGGHLTHHHIFPITHNAYCAAQYIALTTKPICCQCAGQYRAGAGLGSPGFHIMQLSSGRNCKGTINIYQVPIGIRFVIILNILQMLMDLMSQHSIVTSTVTTSIYFI